MFEDANAELEQIDALNRAAPEVLRVRVAIYHGLKKWDALQVVAARLAEFEPTNVQWIVSLAFATRRTDSIEAASIYAVRSRLIRVGAQRLWTTETWSRSGISSIETIRLVT